MIQKNKILLSCCILSVLITFFLPLGFLVTYSSSLPIHGGVTVHIRIISFFYVVGSENYLGPNPYLILIMPIIFIAVAFRIWLPYDIIQHTLGKSGRFRIFIDIILADAQLFSFLFVALGGPYSYYYIYPLPIASLAYIPLYLIISRLMRETNSS